MKVRFFYLLLFLTVAGCVSPAPQTDAFFRTLPGESEASLRAPVGLPLRVEIAHVPFVNQSAGYCGPATLSMAMQWAGQNTGVEMKALGEQVFTPNNKGTFQEDLISASRRHGMMAVPISGLESLLHEIAAHHPVIIFENLGFTWYQRWHYAIVYGYDLPNRKVIMHSGPEKAKHWDIATFERSWEYGDYWGLVVLPPGELSATASELDHLSAAAGLEQIGQAQAAEKSYLSILDRWPGSLAALIGLGNLTYARKDYPAAVAYLRQALVTHPDSQIARHNLAIAERGLAKL